LTVLDFASRMTYLMACFMECDLKKQSQFAKGQNDVRAVLITGYGDFDGPGWRKNKAKQSQFQSLNYSQRVCT